MNSLFVLIICLFGKTELKNTFSDNNDKNIKLIVVSSTTLYTYNGKQKSQGEYKIHLNVLFSSQNGEYFSFTETKFQRQISSLCVSRAR